MGDEIGGFRVGVSNCGQADVGDGDVPALRELDPVAQRFAAVVESVVQRREMGV